jgi:Leucine-rich repeat (LRR) protein
MVSKNEEAIINSIRCKGGPLPYLIDHEPAVTIRREGLRKKVVGLDLSHCELEEVPEAIRGLETLRVLRLSDNRGLNKLPDFLDELPLRHLNISGTDVSSLSNLELKDLEKLIVDAVRYSDTESLTRFENLEKFTSTGSMDMYHPRPFKAPSMT